jgi:hypothetical protein
MFGEHDVLGLKLLGLVEGQAQGPLALTFLFVIVMTFLLRRKL